MFRSRRRFAALFAFLSLVLGVGGAGQAFLAVPASASPAGFAPEQPDPLVFAHQSNWEPTIAADPTDPARVYQLVTAMNVQPCAPCASPSILLRVSNDAGVTWSRYIFVCGMGCKGDNWQFDPQIRVASSGTVYVVFMNTFNPGPVLVKSFDHGRTWTRPVRIIGRLKYGDKPLLVISPGGKDVYVAFNDRDESYVAVSHNFGHSFLPPVRTNTDHRWYYTYGGTIAPNGDVYYPEVGETGPHGGELNSGHLTGPERIVVVRSADGGATWTTTSIATSQAPYPCPVHSCYPDYFAAQASVATDPDGYLVLAYTRNTTAFGPDKLYVRTSADGTHWGPPVLVNALADSYSPQIAAGPTPGSFRLAWWDNRNGPFTVTALGGWNTWLKESTNGGTIWGPAAQLSNRGSGAVYKTRAGYTFPFGDYFGLAVNSAGENFAIWGESDGSDIYCCGDAWYTEGT